MHHLVRVAGLLLLTLAVASGKAETQPEESSLKEAAALLSQNRAKEALSLLSSLHTSQARFYEGLAYRKLGDHAAARSALLDAWKAGCRNDYLLYSLIEEDYALGDKQAGLDHFQLLLKTYPDSAWVNLLLADAHFAKDQNDAAREDYLKALKKKPDLLEANFRLGYMSFQIGDYRNAASYFEREIAVNSGYVDAHVFLAEALNQLGRKPESRTELRKALALDPRNDLVYKRLATTLIEMNDLNEADRILSTAEQQFPKDAAFPAQRARVLKILRQPEAAQAEATRAKQLSADQSRSQKIVPQR